VKNLCFGMIGLLLIIFFLICTKNGVIPRPPHADGIRAAEVGELYAHAREKGSAPDIVNHPAFTGFGRFILPEETGFGWWKDAAEG